MKKCPLLSLGVPIVATLLSIGLQNSCAQSIVLDKNEEQVLQKFSWLPYGFYTESFGLGIGAAAGYSGWPQEQANVFLAATVGTKGSYNLLAGMHDWQVPKVPRLVANPLACFGLYQDQRFFVGQNPDFGGERAGSNDSDPENYIEATEWDNRAEIDFRFLLPLSTF